MRKNMCHFKKYAWRDQCHSTVGNVFFFLQATDLDLILGTTYGP